MSTIIVSDSSKIATLFYYTKVGHLGMVIHEIAQGIDVNSKDGKGLTALHYAVIAPKNSFEIASLLIENGADVNAKSKEGIAPLHSVAAYGTPKVMKLLLKNGANAKARTNSGKTPTDWAASSKIVKLLVSYGGAPKIIKDEGEAPKSKLMTFSKSLSGWLSKKKKT